MEIKVLYEDENLIAVEKQSGVPSQPDKTGDMDLLSTTENYCNCTCHIINRLDRPVGGIVLFAKNSSTANELTNLMNNKGIEKYYKAVVLGKCEDKGRFEDYLLKNSKLNISQISDKSNKNAKFAVLEYEKLLETENHEFGTLSLIKIKLLTGRHHQIRVQFSSRNLPLWGDTKYNPLFAGRRGFFNTALWSYSLKFRFKNKEYDIISEPSIEIFDIFKNNK